MTQNYCRDDLITPDSRLNCANYIDSKIGTLSSERNRRLRQFSEMVWDKDSPGFCIEDTRTAKKYTKRYISDGLSGDVTGTGFAGYVIVTVVAMVVFFNGVDEGFTDYEFRTAWMIGGQLLALIVVSYRLLRLRRAVDIQTDILIEQQKEQIQLLRQLAGMANAAAKVEQEYRHE